MKRTVLRKVEVKVPVTHVDYKIWSWPRRSLRFKILQDGRKKTCTRPGTLIDRTNTSKQWQGRGKRVLGGPRSSLRLPLTRDSGPISTAGHHAVRLPRFRTVYPTQREHGPVLIACFIRSTSHHSNSAGPERVDCGNAKGVLTQLIVSQLIVDYP